MNYFLFSGVDLPCACLDSLWTRARPVWTSGPFVPVLDPCLISVGPWRICGFLWTIGELLLDHCWTVLDSWVISSLGFQWELLVSLPCSEGLEWVVSLEISADFIGWTFGSFEIRKDGRFTRFKSP